MIHSVEMAASKQLNMRMTPDEMSRLEWLSKHYGVGMTDVVRMLVKRDFDATMHKRQNIIQQSKADGFAREKRIRGWVADTKLPELSLDVERDFDREEAVREKDPREILKFTFTLPTGKRIDLYEDEAIWDALAGLPGSKLKNVKPIKP